MSEIRIPFPDPIEPEHTIADVHDAIRKSPELDDDGARELRARSPETPREACL